MSEPKPVQSTTEERSSASAAVTAGGASQESDGSHWSAFASASSDEVFCRSWLALQCTRLSGVRAGLLLLRDPAGQSYVPAAVWPDSRHDVTYLTAAAERALADARGTVLGLDPQDRNRVPAGTVHVACPLEADGQLAGAVVVDLRTRPEGELQAVLRDLLWGTGWLVALLRKHQRSRDAALVDRAAIALDLVQAANEQRSLTEASIAAVNELATVLKADRVSLGIERNGKLRLRAISRTAWFDPKSQLVESIENAMEEAMDQAAPVAYPVPDGTAAKVNVAQRELASRSGASAVLTVPLTSAGLPVGAIAFERRAPLDAEGVLLCEAVGALLGPSLQLRAESERWFAGRLVATLAEWRDRLIGPRRPALKLGFLLVTVAALFLTFADGQFRISARTVVEGAVQRAAVAPFEGYVTEAFVRAGSPVRQGQVLATLDDRDLKLERLRWEAEKEQVARKHREALAKHDRAASRVLAAQLNQVDAQLALAEEKLARTQLVAPFDGVVVSGDLSQMLGAPVEKGKVLFELAPLGKYRIILQIDERDIAHVAAGQRGELALTGVSGGTLPFTVITVTSVSTAQDGRNFFRAEARLEGNPDRIRPGMEGIGKVSIGERRLVWVWTRNFINWVRISLWTWLP